MIINNIERTCSTNIGISLAKKTKIATNIMICTIFFLHFTITFDI